MDKKKNLLIYAVTLILSVLLIFFGHRFARVGMVKDEGAELYETCRARVVSVEPTASHERFFDGDTLAEGAVLETYFTAEITAGERKGEQVRAVQLMEEYYSTGRKYVEDHQKIDPALQRVPFLFQQIVQNCAQFLGAFLVQQDQIVLSLFPVEKHFQKGFRLLGGEGDPVMAMAGGGAENAVVILVGPGDDNGAPGNGIDPVLHLEGHIAAEIQIDLALLVDVGLVMIHQGGIISGGIADGEVHRSNFRQGKAV